MATIAPGIAQLTETMANFDANGRLHAPKVVVDTPSFDLKKTIFYSPHNVWDRDGNLLATCRGGLWQSVYVGTSEMIIGSKQGMSWQDAAVASLDYKIKHDPGNAFRYEVQKAIIRGEK